MAPSPCVCAALLIAATALAAAPAANPAPNRPAPSPLEQAFLAPPDASRPRTWWHWMDGNVSLEGITADLEAMKRAGLGGAWLFNVGLRMPEGPAGFLTPAWLERVEHAVRECDRLGLEFGIHNCDGFSEAGGPWITPEVAMKKLIWTETTVRGPGLRRVNLPQPVANLDYYREVAILAVPAEPAGATAPRATAVRASFGPIDATSLADGHAETVVAVPATLRAKPAWIEFTYAQAIAVRSLTLTTPNLERNVGRPPLVTARLEARPAGGAWRPVAEFNVYWSTHDSPLPATTAAFDEVRAAQFRLSFQDLPAFALAEVAFSAAPRLHLWQARAGWSRIREHGGETLALAAPGGPGREADTPSGLRREDVRVLTPALSPQGTLEWEAPAGEWTILRVGLTATGRKNAPATRLGVGLECDKLSRRGIEAHFPHYVGRLARQYGPLAGRALRVAETDSWECGLQNWTEEFPAEFRARRGYDLLPWLPVLLTGRVIDSAASSERALWDFRRTLADLIKDNYYVPFRDLCHQAGLTYCGEGSGRQQYMYDPINYQSTHDLPMGEFWVPAELRTDNRVAASVAHTYGRAAVTAEAYTGGPTQTRWTNDPFSLKALGDLAFCAGVNGLVFHRYAHQPWMHVAPGMTMGQWGTMLERTVTWWEQSRPWFDYLSRCQHLLRQGEFVADVCHYIGEDVPNFLGHRDDLWLPLPAGHDYDGCNDEILRRFTVRAGRLVLPHGQSYAVLLLPAARTMRPASLRTIRDLVRAGATVIGRRPLRSPSLADQSAGETELRQLGDELWGPLPAIPAGGAGPTASRPALRRLGAGRLVDGEGATWSDVAPLLGLQPDFDPGALAADVQVSYTHRRVAGREVYFVATDARQAFSTRAKFRVTGRRPELWDPLTGAIRALPEFTADGEFTTVPLHFGPVDSLFVVFATETRAPADGSQNFPAYHAVVEMTGAWQVAFDPRWGGPAQVEFPALQDWTTHAQEGIRFYSGAATYRKTFPWKNANGERRAWLNLGNVKNLATVRLNGHDLGILWKPPFRTEITAALRPGNNLLEVSVVNLWVNRLIGDEHLPSDVTWNGNVPAAWPAWLTDPKELRTSGRRTFETFPHWKRSDTPLPSGLLGPVSLEERVP